MCLQVPASSNMIGRNKYKTIESETSRWPRLELVCYPTSDYQYKVSSFVRLLWSPPADRRGTFWPGGCRPAECWFGSWGFAGPRAWPRCVWSSCSGSPPWWERSPHNPSSSAAESPPHDLWGQRGSLGANLVKTLRPSSDITAHR